MSKKWKRIDPAEIKAGDRVKAVGQGLVVTGEVDDDTTNVVIVGDLTLGANAFAWYVRKPKPAKPLTRPDEPPVGTFFRVDRTGCEWERPFRDPKDYELAISPGPRYRVVGESGAYYAWEKDLATCDPHNPVGVEIQGFYDGVAYWQCLVCGHRWHRFSEGDRRRPAVEAMWEGN